MSISTTEYGVDKNILIAPHTAVRIGCIVSNSGVTNTDDKGNLVIKAGSPVGGTTSALTNREAVLTLGSSNAQGVVLHDVVFYNDSTEENATLVIKGTVDRLKLDDDVQALVDAATTLTKIDFVNGSEN